ncbi:hypothetical protein QQ045_007304 [Rhodiola kirilowii]
MIEDIAKLKDFNVSITHGGNITTFIYRHGRLLNAMRERHCKSYKVCYNISYITYLYKNKDALRKLFGSKEWFDSKLATTNAGRKVHDDVLSTRFWNNVEDCIRASQPLLVVLRIVDGDRKPAMAEICVAMDFVCMLDFPQSARSSMMARREPLLTLVISFVHHCWSSTHVLNKLDLQMEQYIDI